MESQSTINQHLVDVGLMSSYRRGDLIQLVFPSIGCQHRPHCTMCNYGFESVNCNSETAIEIIKQTFDKWAPNGFKASGLSKVLLDTYGNLFDPVEMPLNVLEDIVQYIYQYNEWSSPSPQEIEFLIMESAYDTITTAIPCWIPPIRIGIEMGFETLDDNLRRDVLHKIINRDRFCKSIEIIKHVENVALANVLLGVPTLSPIAQIEECLETIIWLIDKGIDEVVVFPLNIKPRTQVFEMYVNGLYQRVSHQQLINLLAKIPDQYITKVTLSWYGDRQLYRPTDIGKIDISGLPPDGDPRYIRDYMGYYDQFNRASTVLEKREAVTKLASIVLNDERRGD